MADQSRQPARFDRRPRQHGAESSSSARDPLVHMRPHRHAGQLSAFVADLRRHAASADGTLDLPRYQRWRAERAGAAHAFPAVWRLLDTPDGAQRQLDVHVPHVARRAVGGGIGGPPAPPAMPNGGGSGGFGLGDELGLLALGGNNGFGGLGGIANQGTLTPTQQWGGLAQAGFGLMGGQSLGAATLGAVGNLYQQKLLNGIAGRLSGDTGGASTISDTGTWD